MALRSSLLLTAMLLLGTLVVTPVNAHHCPLGQDALLRHTILCPNAPPEASFPTGPERLDLGVSGRFCATYSDPDADAGTLRIYWDDTTGGHTEWQLQGNATRCAYRSWDVAGYHCVKAHAQDAYGAEGSSYCRYVYVVASPPPNRGPDPPTINGARTGRAGAESPFCAQSFDPDGDDVRFEFNWDDGTPATWSDWTWSGGWACVWHTWPIGGTFHVVAFAEDRGGRLSWGSEPYTVTVSWS